MGPADVQPARGCPVYFFDQPARQQQEDWLTGTILYSILRSKELQPEGTPLSKQEEKEKDESNNLNNENDLGEACEDVKPDPSSFVHFMPEDPMDAYRRAALPLLNELAHVLSKHKWTEEVCIPGGIVNILNYSWHDLTAGAALRLKKLAPIKQKRRKSKAKIEEIPHQVPDGAKDETGERNPHEERNAGSFLTKSKENQCKKKRKQSINEDPDSPSVRISLITQKNRNSGEINLLNQNLCDDPESIRVSRWVVDRLRASRNSENLSPHEEDTSLQLILRHYNEGKSEHAKRRKTMPALLINGLPQMPEMKPPNPVQHKLHYRIDDGSSFIYYPSGCIAVCHSHSGLPAGGFYTNVFSDGESPAMLVTITAFGHGAVTDIISSTITAVWDQDGGLMFDHHGNTTKDWSWQTFRVQKKDITIQVSEQISVKLSSGMSGVLSFRCENKVVRLPLSFVTDKSQFNAQTNPDDISESEEFRRRLSMFRKEQYVEQYVEEPSTLWRRRGNAEKELYRLQQRVWDAVDSWLEFYRVTLGIKCSDTERLTWAPVWGWSKQSDALPSLNSPEQTETGLLHAGRSRKDELKESHRGLLGSANEDHLIHMQRRFASTKELPVARIGPFRIYGNFKPGLLNFCRTIESEAISRYGLAFTPRIPLTTCPALLRAALRGEERRKNCSCSATEMPVVTDLEYDALILGQPLDSKQILVVCVTTPQEPVNTHTASSWDDLEDLYRNRNKQRTMPCTQCQMDSFRLVRYEISDCGMENNLLQQRHGAAPGMFLMYIKGRLLFLGYISKGDSISVGDLQIQIYKSRKNYRRGLSLPANQKFSDAVKFLQPQKQRQKNQQDVTPSGLIRRKKKEGTWLRS